MVYCAEKITSGYTIQLVVFYIEMRLPKLCLFALSLGRFALEGFCLNRFL